MASPGPLSLWRRLLELPNTSPTKTLVMAIIVSLVCAVTVSVTAVTLKPLQDANQLAERQARMEQMLATLPGLGDLIAEAGGDALDAYLVDLATGSLVDGDALAFDQLAAADDPETSTALSAEADIAGLGQRENTAPVYVLRDGDDLSLVVLPVRGQGYQSLLQGYLALNGNLETIAALTFYEQGETPGLGSRIQEPAWEALWPGTEYAGPDGEIRVEVVRGKADEPWEVDGITGATRTSNGVSNLVRFWLGPDGYGPFLTRLASGEAGL